MGNVNIAAPSRCKNFGEMAQMHRQLGRDLRIGELIQQLEFAASVGTEEYDCPSAPQPMRKAPIGIAAILVVGGAPDMLKALFMRHRTDRTGLALDNGVAHAVGRTLLRKIAIGVEGADVAVDVQR